MSTIPEEYPLFTEYLKYRQEGIKDPNQEACLIGKAKHTFSHIVWVPSMHKCEITVLCAFTAILSVYYAFFAAEPVGIEIHVGVFFALLGGIGEVKKHQQKSFERTVYIPEVQKPTRDLAVYGILSENFSALSESTMEEETVDFSRFPKPKKTFGVAMELPSLFLGLGLIVYILVKHELGL